MRRGAGQSPSGRMRSGPPYEVSMTVFSIYPLRAITATRTALIRLRLAVVRLGPQSIPVAGPSIAVFPSGLILRIHPVDDLVRVGRGGYAVLRLDIDDVCDSRGRSESIRVDIPLQIARVDQVGDLVPFAQAGERDLVTRTGGVAQRDMRGVWQCSNRGDIATVRPVISNAIPGLGWQPRLLNTATLLPDGDP